MECSHTCRNANTTMRWNNPFNLSQVQLEQHLYPTFHICHLEFNALMCFLPSLHLWVLIKVLVNHILCSLFWYLHLQMQLHCLNIEHFASGKGLEKYMGGSLPSVIKKLWFDENTHKHNYLTASTAEKLWKNANIFLSILIIIWNKLQGLDACCNACVRTHRICTSIL